MIFTRFLVFGWYIDRQTFNDAEEYTTVFRQDTRLELSENSTIWTKGARTIIAYPDGFNDDFLIQTRNKFFNKTDLSGHVYKRGVYIFKMIGPTEFWCLNYRINKNDCPDLTPVFLSANQTYSPSVGELLLVANGQTSIGEPPTQAVVATPNLVITASTDSVLIIFSRRT